MRKILWLGALFLAVPAAQAPLHAAPGRPPRRAAAPRVPSGRARPAARVIAGRVLLPDGQPAAGARLFISAEQVGDRPKFIELAADRDGRFRRAVPGGETG